MSTSILIRPAGPSHRAGSASHSATIFLTVVVMFGGVLAWSQRQGSGSSSSSTNSNTTLSGVIPTIDPLDMPPVYEGDPIRMKAEAKRLEFLNAQRQKAMVADTNRLVKMASDLNAQINSQQHSQLTSDQVRQLAEIEKLAHSIRDKMSTSIKQPQPFDMPPVLPPMR